MGVERGDLGGFIETEENLSQDYNAWVYGNACVYGDARVLGRAQVLGDARVYGNAQVYGSARVSGNALVSGNARVYEDAQVYGYARVYEDFLAAGDSQVYLEAVEQDRDSCADDSYLLSFAKHEDRLQEINDMIESNERNTREQKRILGCAKESASLFRSRLKENGRPRNPKNMDEVIAYTEMMEVMLEKRRNINRSRMALEDLAEHLVEMNQTKAKLMLEKSMQAEAKGKTVQDVNQELKILRPNIKIVSAKDNEIEWSIVFKIDDHKIFAAPNSPVCENDEKAKQLSIYGSKVKGYEFSVTVSKNMHSK